MPLSLAVLDVVAQVLGTREVIDDPDLPLYEHDLLDSLRTVELIVALSDTFHIQISPAASVRMFVSPIRLASALVLLIRLVLRTCRIRICYTDTEVSLPV